MRKRIRTHKKKKKSFLFMIFFFLFLLGVFLSYYKLNKSKIILKDNFIVSFLKKHTLEFDDSSIIKDIIKYGKEKSNPVKMIYNNYSIDSLKKESYKKEEKKEIKPLIYIYNTHQNEEYSPSNYIEFSINPTVMMNDYILEDVFSKKKIGTVVEEASIENILKENNWKYYNSYKASRLLLEEAKKKYPSLEYFIDVHRDSLTRDKTTIMIGDKSYAKILFIVGLENKNYQGNYEFTEKISNKLNEKYPNISKGIYKKSGVGVNGIYNQDFSSHTILIEIGGYENTTVEVLNSTLAFGECFMEVINE